MNVMGFRLICLNLTYANYFLCHANSILFSQTKANSSDAVNVCSR